jgi:condensin-2 complex subunit G2
MSNNIGREHFQVLNTFWLSQYSNFWQVANSNVRLNALHLLLDVFPLEDPDVTKDVNDPLLEKQFFLLDKLLMDDCPEIRAVTVEGLCRILNQFWEVIPSPTISKNLSKIVDDMSKDSCNDVRLSTLNGLIYLLDNPQSHDILKILLPRLSDMVSDPALSVRVAAVDLLLAIRDLRSFQYNKVWYIGIVYIS